MSTVVEIHTIDLHWLGRPEDVAAYVLRGRDGAVLIETGPASCLGAMQRGLHELGLAPTDIDDVLVSHIHLDHAGAAWWWATHGGSHGLGATVHVHPKGAPHLVDPHRLVRSARRIYGDRMDELWGAIRPAPAHRVRPVADGQTISAGGLSIRAVETPGHARHHHAYVLDDDTGRRIVFTGDAAAMRVVGTDFVNLPTPPPEFDLEQWDRSLEELLTLTPDVIYPTHFGPFENPAPYLQAVRDALTAHVQFVQERLESGRASKEILPDYRLWVRAKAVVAGVSARQLENHVTDGRLAMNITGIERYLARRRETQADTARTGPGAPR